MLGRAGTPRVRRVWLVDLSWVGSSIQAHRNKPHTQSLTLPESTWTSALRPRQLTPLKSDNSAEQADRVGTVKLLHYPRLMPYGGEF